MVVAVVLKIILGSAMWNTNQHVENMCDDVKGVLV